MTTRNRELASIIDASGNITASGNLTVSGTTTAVSSTNTTVSDPLIELNSGASSNSNDLGFVFERGSTGNNAALIWDESNDTFALGTTTATGSSTGNMSISAAGITLSTINGLTYPTSDGSANQVLKTDGSGALSFANPTVTSIAVENESGNGSTTAFTLSADPGTENNTQVYIDGVYQFKNTYTVSGTTLTFDTAPANGASIEIIAITAGSLNNPADDTVSTAKIQNNAVTADKIVANAVGISELNVSDGSNGQVLTTNGSGTLSFTSKTASLTGIDDQSSSNDDQITITDTAVVINEDSDDVDFRVEGNGEANLLFVNAGDDRVGMGSSSPVSRLHISGNSDSGEAECTLTIDDEDTTSGSMVPAIQFRGNGNNLARIRANDQQGLLISGSSGNEDDIVVQEGKVGMGTNSPAVSKGLHINSAGNTELRLTTTQDSGTPTAQIGYGAGSGYFLRLADAANNEDVMLRTYGKSVFNGGGVVIGTTSANAPFDNSMLHVTQSTSHADPVLALDSNNGDQSYYRYIRFYKKTSNQVGRLDADISGSSMGLHYESDGRYKEVLGVADGMNLIEKLNPIKFKWLDGTGEGSQGFKAQEYKQAFNDVGSYARGVIEPEDESTEKWMLDYTHLMPNVIKALQELSAKNDALEARIQELEG